MKDIIFKLVVVIVLGFITLKASQWQEENERLSNNQDILLAQRQDVIAEAQAYKVSDSLNAAKVSELQLTLNEYKKYRASDLQLIKDMKLQKSELQKVVDVQAETIKSLSASLSDSIRIDTATSQIDTLKCFSYKSIWADISGCVDLKTDSIEIQINNRESLKVIESVKYKRFLGFLWKTSKVKSRQVDVISENPNTTITNLEYIGLK